MLSFVFIGPPGSRRIGQLFLKPNPLILTLDVNTAPSWSNSLSETFYIPEQNTAAELYFKFLIGIVSQVATLFH